MLNPVASQPDGRRDVGLLEGTAETIAVAAIMFVGYRVSGRVARRRAVAAEPAGG
jgi:hypothetical protein